MNEIAIIGAGPAGIASASEAMMEGITNIALFEKAENHSETIRRFYKDHKRVDRNWKGQRIEIEGRVVFMDGTKESTLDYFDLLLEQHRIEAHFQTEVTEVVPHHGGFLIKTANKEQFRARFVIIAIGNMGKPNTPSYPLPSSLRERITHNLEGCGEGESILVVGGGDSAAEYAYYLADLNAVTLSYRKPTFTRLNEHNEHTLHTYVSLGRMELKMGVEILSVTDEEGRCRVDFADGSLQVYDRIIYAIGGSLPVELLKRCGVGLDESGMPQVNEHNESATPGIYVAGDIIARSGGSIAVGLNHGYRIIRHIKERMRAG